MKQRTPIALQTWIIGIILTLCTVQPGIAQQRMQFTQYMFNGVVINPAYAGADDALSLTFIQRTQWSGIEKAPSTQTFSGHTLFKKKHFGLGITLVNDKLGVHRNLNALTHYAYHIRTGPLSYLSMGIEAGIYSLKSDYASLVDPANRDPQISNPVRSQTFLDFGAGIYFRSQRFHAGLSAPEIVPQQFTINDTLSIRLSKVNFFLFSKYRLSVSDQVDLEPSTLFKYLDGVPLSYDANLNMIYREVLTLGLSYRRNESVDFILRMQINRQLRLGYSYDHPFGMVSRLSGGSHELMVNYAFRNVQKNVISPR
jgi:type IX secretion system PorP/SprF family membrane protein